MSRLKSLFAQLPAPVAVRTALSHGLSKLGGPVSLSYSQTGEDLIIARLLGHSPGFYVDVGCHDPISMSNTYKLYGRGWRGIAVDANAEFGAAFRKVRPKDEFICACVSDEAGDANFNIYRDRALSSVTDEKLFESDQYTLERVVQVPRRSLTEILTSSDAPADFDLLSIDVEGHDEAVLRSLDLSRFHPRLIVIELHGAPAEAMGEHTVAKHLKAHGYAIAGFTGNNAFFVKSDLV